MTIAKSLSLTGILMMSSALSALHAQEPPSQEEEAPREQTEEPRAAVPETADETQVEDDTAQDVADPQAGMRDLEEMDPDTGQTAMNEARMNEAQSTSDRAEMRLRARSQAARANASSLSQATAQRWSAETELLDETRDGISLTAAAISGEELLNAELVNATRTVGIVDDIILDEDGAVQYIRYETSRFRDLDEQGYVAVDDLEIEPSTGLRLEVALDGSQEEGASGTTLTAADLESRQLSSIIRNEVAIGDELYSIRDVVFDRTGDAEYLLVARSSGGFMQGGETWAVPFDNLTYSEGAFRSDMETQELPTIYFYIG